MIFQIISLALATVDDGVLFILGQSYYEDKKKFIRLYEAYEVYYVAIVFALHSIVYILILPFIKLYTSGVTHINYIDFWLPILFVLLNLLSSGRMPGINAINILLKEAHGSLIKDGSQILLFF